jgi:protein-disulfide isomerase
MQMKKNYIFIGVILLVAILGFFFSARVFQGTQKDTAQSQASSVNMKDLIKDHSPTMGPKDAPVQIVEFLDPECESCRQMDPVVKGLLKEYEGKIFFVLRYMPYHSNSMLAAVSLEEAREQGKYWEALSTLFFHQPEWGAHHDPRPELIAKYLIELGIKPESLKEAKLLEKHKWKVDLDRADGEKVGVSGTPTFFVNGKMQTQIGYESLKAAIESHLNLTTNQQLGTTSMKTNPSPPFPPAEK